MSEPRRSGLVYLLVALLFAESALLAVASVYLIVELFIAAPDSYGSAIALAALAAVTCAWLAVIGVQTLRGRPWVRAAAIVWQVLQIAIAVGSLQGAEPRVDVAVLLLIPAIAVIALLFAKPVIAATARRDS